MKNEKKGNAQHKFPFININNSASEIIYSSSIMILPYLLNKRIGLQYYIYFSRIQRHISGPTIRGAVINAVLCKAGSVSLCGLVQSIVDNSITVSHYEQLVQLVKGRPWYILWLYLSNCVDLLLIVDVIPCNVKI